VFLPVSGRPAIFGRYPSLLVLSVLLPRFLFLYSFLFVVGFFFLEIRPTPLGQTPLSTRRWPLVVVWGVGLITALPSRPPAPTPANRLVTRRLPFKEKNEDSLSILPPPRPEAPALREPFFCGMSLEMFAVLLPLLRQLPRPLPDPTLRCTSHDGEVFP